MYLYKVQNHNCIFGFFKQNAQIDNFLEIRMF